MLQGEIIGLKGALCFLIQGFYFVICFIIYSHGSYLINEEKTLVSFQGFDSCRRVHLKFNSLFLIIDVIFNKGYYKIFGEGPNILTEKEGTINGIAYHFIIMMFLFCML